ncbi:MAG: hypothetical protein R6U63_06615 [Longimicrobiales bacterium]
MRAGAALLGALLVAGGCADPGARTSANRMVVTTDTADPELLAPGIILRHGPATPEAVAGPVRAPVVEGDRGQLSIYDGYFILAACATPIRVTATRGDTITVRVVSEPDTARAGPCQERPKPIGYAMLVGQFEPDRYTVRLIHEGDGARPTPLDTVYDNITIQPK